MKKTGQRGTAQKGGSTLQESPLGWTTGFSHITSELSVRHRMTTHLECNSGLGVMVWPLLSTGKDYNWTQAASYCQPGAEDRVWKCEHGLFAFRLLSETFNLQSESFSQDAGYKVYITLKSEAVLISPQEDEELCLSIVQVSVEAVIPCWSVAKLAALPTCRIPSKTPCVLFSSSVRRSSSRCLSRMCLSLQQVPCLALLLSTLSLLCDISNPGCA